VIESALAIGLALVPEAERDPLKARSTGLGELVSLALREEPRELLVGVGGTATIDGGAGVLAAIEPDQIARTNVKILCDVGTAWSRAAAVYGPQKGADPDEVATLERRLDQLAGRLKRDPRARAATGAGGGISGAFWSLGAELVSGADTILDLVGIDRRLVGVDLVVTGEGRLDEQTAEGKLVARVVERAQRAGVRSVAVVGQVTAAAAPIKALGLEDIFVAGDSVALRLTGERIAAALARSGGGLHC
jgi:glycerate kinase